MSKINKIKNIVNRCQQDSAYFIDNYCKVKHPNAGIIPFRLFSYQRTCLNEFKKHRFNIFGKTRQCFDEDTLIRTPNGTIPIKCLRSGDEVYSYHHSLNSVDVGIIEKVFDNGFAECVELITDNGIRLVVTSDHRFFIPNKGYIPLSDFSNGDKLLEANLFGISEVRIKSIKPIGERRVYDIHAWPYNNYLPEGVVVHNCGISTLSGAYALWYAMFFKSKTILITSKRDADAKEFMNKNIKFVYKYLPKWMRKVWIPTIDNEHQFGFSNGSKITSLPSGPDTLRQYSSSLNIIDEAAFYPHMREMWSGGASTLVHGGQLLVISTSKGIGNWYWETWTDALDGNNEFNPIIIDWWDMDWAIEYIDDSSKKPVRICPTDGIRKCETKAEIEKYGEYWSPWLEEQYKLLVAKGNDAKFRQEVLRDFLGSGNTVLPRDTLLLMRKQAKEHGKKYLTVNHVDYVHPINGESYHIDFNDELWIWNEPQENHGYIMGVDISSGEASDWSSIEVFDITTMEQVAELETKVQPKQLGIMADYLGRWYNMAFIVPERSGMGVTVCQDLGDLSYPNVFRKGMLPAAHKKPVQNMYSGPIGYNTTGVGKPIINKALIDNLGEGGFTIKSNRLSKQAETYIHLNASKTGAESGANDDVIIATGLALVGASIAAGMDNSILMPFNSNINFSKPRDDDEEVDIRDYNAIAPQINGKAESMQETMDAEMNRFSNTLIAPVSDSMMPVKPKKNVLKR